MTYRGERVWEKNTTDALTYIRAHTWVGLDDAFTYPGHGGSSPKESEDRCIDIWTGTSATGKKLGDELVAWLIADNGARMEQLGIWYIVWYERIYSLTRKQLIKGLGSGQKYRARSKSASDRHTNHVHLSRYANRPIKVTVPAPKPTLPTYWVDPAKVSSYLWGVRDADGSLVKQRKPGFEIATGKEIVTRNGRKWLLTFAGYRYAIDYLTTTIPA